MGTQFRHLNSERVNYLEIFVPTWVFVPTSRVIGKHWWGLIPAKAVYKDNFPIGIPIP